MHFPALLLIQPVKLSQVHFIYGLARMDHIFQLVHLNIAGGYTDARRVKKINISI